MAETFFLSRVAAYLAEAKLAPVLRVGVAEPAQASELPAIVLSLEATVRANPGVGGAAERVVGRLPWSATIDLAHRLLPEGPAPLDPTPDARRTLLLPHGGLVKSGDGSDPGDAPLTAADVTVSIAQANGAATPLTVVTGAPGPNEVRADGRTGTLVFGADLPDAGTVAATYVLGQWERRVERISGTLRLDVCAGAGAAADAAALSDAAVEALLAAPAGPDIPRLLAIALASLGSVGAPEAPLALRRRPARLTFTFEREVNRPDSSGGVIRRIGVTSKLDDGVTPSHETPHGTEQFTVTRGGGTTA